MASVTPAGIPRLSVRRFSRQDTRNGDLSGPAGQGSIETGQREMSNHWKRLEFWRVRCRRLCRDDSGQDMIEYALLAASLVVIVAAFVPVHAIPAVSTVFSRILSVMSLI